MTIFMIEMMKGLIERIFSFELDQYVMNLLVKFAFVWLMKECYGLEFLNLCSSCTSTFAWLDSAFLELRDSSFVWPCAEVS